MGRSAWTQLESGRLLTKRWPDHIRPLDSDRLWLSGLLLLRSRQRRYQDVPVLAPCARIRQGISIAPSFGAVSVLKPWHFELSEHQVETGFRSKKIRVQSCLYSCVCSCLKPTSTVDANKSVSAHQSIVESQDKTEMRSTSTSSGNGTLQFLLTKVKTLWPGRFRNNTSNRSAGIRKSVNTNSAYSTFNDQQTSDEPYPLTSVISVTEASAFADAWAGELSPGTKADLRRADVLVKRELGRSSETLESAGEAIPVSDHYRGSNTRDFAV